MQLDFRLSALLLESRIISKKSLYLFRIYKSCLQVVVSGGDDSNLRYDIVSALAGV